ncbi:hypothetical protein SAICODRAFT_8923 [Saitoella complicata NRRL Y-17804]|uniref:HAUS augmin-like complex subunit 6 N-terminal domain-containing protein n=1 Tax=Saitoella complicata (strain BCRC 22490 / CBS 7301 / JCM 7358 / NBRC 10748 / NRRL Y-17804) TaxID=698492 RepID=A0A0E9NC59_SAICN|nr:uncharacterized protein SAICODRAFT_8923 [Saitoella complicata NRRL Y-17804]ODQ51627.1 hypothetical protein SAICODRAFT_8923 [Saitoella complicata NRRL Y-17804]GAO47378.1 hypothetical protein G7K_1586-t1 [Saitoella complicata NRRL Y-17804]
MREVRHLILDNLRLLGVLDKAQKEHELDIAPETFTSVKNKGKAMEVIVYHLFKELSLGECRKRFDQCWPIYQPIQSKEFRNVAFKWLSDLKQSGALGPTIVRRSLLEDCQGERYEELILAFSSYVLRESLMRGLPSQCDILKLGQAAPTLSASELQQSVSQQTQRLHSLQTVREQAEEAAATFSAALDAKEKDVEQRIEDVGNLSDMSAAELQVLRQQHEHLLQTFTSQWTGDACWVNSLRNTGTIPNLVRPNEAYDAMSPEELYNIEESRGSGTRVDAYQNLQDALRKRKATQKALERECARLKEKSKEQPSKAGKSNGGLDVNMDKVIQQSDNLDRVQVQHDRHLSILTSLKNDLNALTEKRNHSKTPAQIPFPSTDIGEEMQDAHASSEHETEWRPLPSAIPRPKSRTAKPILQASTKTAPRKPKLDSKPEPRPRTELDQICDNIVDFVIDDSPGLTPASFHATPAPPSLSNPPRALAFENNPMTPPISTTPQGLSDLDMSIDDDETFSPIKPRFPSLRG